MGVLAWIVGLVLAAGFIMSGMGKIRGLPMMNASRDKFGFADNMWKGLGGLEVLGGAGVIIGLVSDGGSEWIGVLAALGLIITTIGALVYHARAGDEPKDMGPAAMMLLLSVVYVVLLAVR